MNLLLVLSFILSWNLATASFIIHQVPSPNFSERPKDAVIDTLVIHHTAEQNCEDALHILTDPNRAGRVSSHYLICRNGTVYQLVDEKNAAWHAGVSEWFGRKGLNGYSIGIELDNNGSEPF